MLLLNSILWIFFILLAGTSLYFLVLSVASVFPIGKISPHLGTKHRIAVLIPAYKEDEVIVQVAKYALQQSYDSNYFEVVIIADSLKPETVKRLKELPIKVIEVSFEKSTKSKALNRAMAVLGDEFDIAMILDADNVMEDQCLEEINRNFSDHVFAIQCHRAAKNHNTSIAVLDALSEEINNSLFRKGLRVLGFSSGLIGSGMAFRYDYFKLAMSEIDAVGGFDKELELRILGDRHTIHYLNDVYVYDEKVQKKEVFYNQRRRWISSQGRNLANFVGKALKQLLKGNIDYFNKVYQWLLPPRVIYIGLLFLMSFGVILFHPDEVMVYAWLTLLIAGVLSFILAIPRSYYNLKTLRALMSLPMTFFLVFKAMFQIKGSNKEFIHTKHTTVGVDSIPRTTKSRKAS
jgi:cellulose synthase/poly-beta-1,6-N-acetylglucosamine synthase-like glycosyltransferase